MRLIISVGSFLAFLVGGIYLSSKDLNEPETVLIRGEGKGNYPKIQWQPAVLEKAEVVELLSIPGDLKMAIIVLYDHGNRRQNLPDFRRLAHYSSSMKVEVGQTVYCAEIRTVTPGLSDRGFRVIVPPPPPGSEKQVNNK